MKPEKYAKKILDDLELDNAPIPVEEIAAHLGAQLSYEPFQGKGELSGMLLRDKDRAVIGVNSAHPSVRQRFSVAHEIGHLVMHEGAMFVDQTVRFNRDGKSSLAIDPQEIEANQFAAELLMPGNLVKAAVQKRTSKKPNIPQRVLIADLAKEFQVSEQAMEFRLINLGII